MTLSLFVLMTTVIAEEFKPQDKLETGSFEINPKVEDIKVIQRKLSSIKSKSRNAPAAAHD